MIRTMFAASFAAALTIAMAAPASAQDFPSRPIRIIVQTQPGGLIAFFNWIAENVGTYTQTWIYPAQRNGWSMVSVGKFGSWFLPLIISYTFVVLIKQPTREEGRLALAHTVSPQT
ncbi:MAG: DUF817 family protein [Xanthobacteraceae bacterium]